MYWDNDASIERTQKALSRDVRIAKEKSLKHKLADKTPRRKRPKGVPKRGRMMRLVLQVPTSEKEKGVRAVVGAFLFGIIGGAIALFTAGMPLKGKPPPEKEGAVAVAWVITACLFFTGALIGWFTGRKKHIHSGQDEETQEKEELT